MSRDRDDRDCQGKDARPRLPRSLLLACEACRGEAVVPTGAGQPWAPCPCCRRPGQVPGWETLVEAPGLCAYLSAGGGYQDLAARLDLVAAECDARALGYREMADRERANLFCAQAAFAVTLRQAVLFRLHHPQHLPGPAPAPRGAWLFMRRED